VERPDGPSLHGARRPRTPPAASPQKSGGYYKHSVDFRSARKAFITGVRTEFGLPDTVIDRLLVQKFGESAAQRIRDGRQQLVQDSLKWL
jgi:hypothetical protein